MKIAEIISPWAGAGTEESPNVARIFQDYPVYKAEDTTNHPTPKPEPNTNVFKTIVSDAVLDQITADPEYFVIWFDDITVEGFDG